VQIFRHNEQGLPTTIVARSGKLKFIEGQNILKVDLNEGQIHEIPQEKQRESYRRTSFKTYSINIRDVDRSLQRTERDYRGDREMSVGMMKDKIKEIRSEMEMARQEMIREATERIDGTFGLLDQRARDREISTADTDTLAAAKAQPRLRARPRQSAYAGVPMAARNEYLTRQRIETEVNKNDSFEKQIQRYWVEIHKKYSIPFACVVFVLVGSPLAIRMSRSGMNMAIGLSILFFLVYYVCLIGGEKLADRGFTTPFIAMWAPNIIFGALAVVLLRKAASEQALFERPPVFTRSFYRRDASSNPR
jgi:lipopolysaccharide export system permease protein